MLVTIGVVSFNTGNTGCILQLNNFEIIKLGIHVDLKNLFEVKLICTS